MMHPISDVDLLAYLEGEEIPGLDEALRASPALQQKLEELRALDAWLYQTFDGIGRPAPGDLVDVALEQASDQQKLFVAAYERNSLRGRAEMASLRHEARQQRARPQQRPSSPWFARLVASPNASHTSRPQAAGVRSSDAPTMKAGAMTERFYVVEEAQASVRIQITHPLYGERWIMSGMINHTANEEAPLADLLLILQNQRGGRGLRATTNSLGYFTFRDIKAGIYQLKIHFAEGIAIIADLVLTE
ncbi:MAG: carboxypeptidase regulatory-like domain-containing protein [Caldilinea sp. CFX5]|nr:carboxypeptidase regulatory-like domain-containing protein [Caldilinea sp. CFX5]